MDSRCLSIVLVHSFIYLSLYPAASPSLNPAIPFIYSLYRPSIYLFIRVCRIYNPEMDTEALSVVPVSKAQVDANTYHPMLAPSAGKKRHFI